MFLILKENIYVTSMCRLNGVTVNINIYKNAPGTS